MNLRAARPGDSISSAAPLPLDRVQCTVYIIQYSVYSIHCKCTKYSKQCTLCTVHCTAPFSLDTAPISSLIYKIFETATYSRAVHSLPYSVQPINTLYTVPCTQNTIHCTMYSVNCTVYRVHCTVYTVKCTLYSVHYTVTVHTLHSRLCPVISRLYSRYWSGTDLMARCNIPYSLHSAHCTL